MTSLVQEHDPRRTSSAFKSVDLSRIKGVCVCVCVRGEVYRDVRGERIQRRSGEVVVGIGDEHARVP